MPNFEYYRDAKVTTWERTYFSVEANTQEQADLIAQAQMDYPIDNIQYPIEISETEIDFCSCDLIPVDQNDGRPTIKIYRNDKLLVNNLSDK